MNRRLSGILILLAIPLTAGHLASLAASFDGSGVVPVLFGLWLGAAAIDGLTGLVHWGCDTWGDEHTRWIGPGLIRGFREHHRDPRAMLVHDWVVVNREPAVAATAALLILATPAVHGLVVSHAAVYAFLCSFIAYGAAANQLHCWAHQDRPPAWIAALQRAGLVLSPERHARHHRAPRTSSYCISTGWLNPLLDAIGFWRALERGVSRLTGARPRAALPAEPLDTPFPVKRSRHRTSLRRSCSRS